MIAASEDNEYNSHSALSDSKEKLVLTDFIKVMDIADGLKELLISSGFTVKSLLDTSAYAIYSTAISSIIVIFSAVEIILMPFVGHISFQHIPRQPEYRSD